MSEVFEFDGSIEIAGVAQCDRIAMLFSAEAQQAVIWDARLGGAAKKTLHLLPCSVWMMRGPGPYATKGEFHYAVSGTRVGSYSEGPLGHPGDGEFDSRPISNFELRCKFSPDSLMVEIGGVTEEGISGFEQELSNPLPPWPFRVRFVVPRAHMKKFFGFKDHNFPYFEESLDECR
jgi:hypothetical protein